MRKKILKVMMCAITTMTLLAGCGSSNTGSTTGSAGDTAAEVQQKQRISQEPSL